MTTRRKRCPATRCPRLIPTTARYCDEHTSEYEARRGSARQRGYNTAHERLRAQWQARLDAGEVIHCADGCGQRINPTAWQLGHDHERGGYLGPQTIGCNASEGGSRGRATQQ